MVCGPQRERRLGTPPVCGSQEAARPAPPHLQQIPGDGVSASAFGWLLGHKWDRAFVKRPQAAPAVHGSAGSWPLGRGPSPDGICHPLVWDFRPPELWVLTVWCAQATPFTVLLQQPEQTETTRFCHVTFATLLFCRPREDCSPPTPTSITLTDARVGWLRHLQELAERTLSWGHFLCVVSGRYSQRSRTVRSCTLPQRKRGVRNTAPACGARPLCRDTEGQRWTPRGGGKVPSGPWPQTEGDRGGEARLRVSEPQARRGGAVRASPVHTQKQNFCSS